MTEKNFAERLHDGMRLLSDDFGEQDDDDLVTFEDNIDELIWDPEEQRGE